MYVTSEVKDITPETVKISTIICKDDLSILKDADNNNNNNEDLYSAGIRQLNNAHGTLKDLSPHWL